MPAVLLPLLLVAMFVLLVLPGRRRVQAQRALLASLEVGDEVVTSGGIIGTIVAIGPREVSLEVASGTVIRVALAAVIGRPVIDQASDASESTPVGDGAGDVGGDVAQPTAPKPEGRRSPRGAAEGAAHDPHEDAD